MNPHFFTAPFYFVFIWFRVQGSRGGFAAKKEANPASLRSAAPSKGRGSRGCSLLPMEGGAPKGRRLDEESGIPDTKPSPRGEGCDTRIASSKKKAAKPPREP